MSENDFLFFQNEKSTNLNNYPLKILRDFSFQIFT
jgi:hypothetical protein